MKAVPPELSPVLQSLVGSGDPPSTWKDILPEVHKYKPLKMSPLIHHPVPSTTRVSFCLIGGCGPLGILFEVL